MDATAFGAEMVALVKDFLEQEIDPLRQKLAALEQQLASLPKPKETDVDDITKTAARLVRVDVDDLLRDVMKTGDGEAMIAKAVQSLPEPLTVETVKSIVGEAVAAIPKPVDGKSIDPADVQRMVDEAAAKLPTIEMAEARIAAEVEKAFSAIEKPKDGHSPKLEEYAVYLDEAVQRAAAALPVPKDGVSLAGAVIDREGSLILTLSDGSTRDLGKVVGKDADPVDMAAIERSIVEKITAIPVPKDGQDGVGFDDMTCELRDDGVYLVWEKGEVIKEARLPVPIYRGVWKDGAYHKGDTVTWGGSTWIAEGDPSGKPDAPDSGWRLAVKKGRDGKDGIVKEQKPAGPVKVG